MKHLSLLLLLAGAGITAQAPAGYYTGTENLSGYELKTKLSEIITNGAQDLGYNALWEIYKTSDVDRYYENNGTVLDIYSERPNGPDSYEYRFGVDQCRAAENPPNEGNCYNREHTLPKSYFGSRTPMANDAHYIVPADYYVNMQRSNYPYAEVFRTVWTSSNGSKLGTADFPGYGGTAFEPIDEFKGDLARMHLYFITRYEPDLPGITSNTPSYNVLDGTTNRGYKQWYINLLLKWSAQDPVSQKEVDRNNAVYAKQGNRNPFIDHPEWVEKIWTNTLSAQETAALPKTLSVYPNPVSGGSISVSGYGLPDRGTVQIFSADGRLIRETTQDLKTNKKISVNNLSAGTYFIQVDEISARFIVK